MNRILPLIFGFLLASSSLFGQTVYNLSFLNGTTSGGQFCVDIFMSFDAADGLGTSNLYFTFDKTNLSSPTISTEELTGAGGYSTPTLTTPSDGVAAFNVVLNSAANSLAIGNTDTKVATICFTAVDLGAVMELTWITSGRFASIVFLDDEATLLSPGTMVNWNGAVFPVEWLDFTAEQEGADAILDWATATEINNKNFEIERSVDGQTFELIGSTPGKGNTQSVSTYTYVDRGAGSLGFKKLFYRLRQVDYDGTFEYSPTVELGISSDNPLSIIGYPNPFNNELSVRFSSIVRQSMSIEIVNALGQKMYDTTTSEVEGELNIDVTDWAEGVYYLSITGPRHREVYKILKEI